MWEEFLLELEDVEGVEEMDIIEARLTEEKEFAKVLSRNGH